MGTNCINLTNGAIFNPLNRKSLPTTILIQDGRFLSLLQLYRLGRACHVGLAFVLGKYLTHTQRYFRLGYPVRPRPLLSISGMARSVRLITDAIVVQA